MEDNEGQVEVSKDARTWGMLCHLIALVGMLGNGIGFVLGPLVLWLVKKNDDPFIDEQGKEAVNFQLTMFLACLVALPLCLVLIGFLFIAAIAVFAIVFPIIAGIKANDGVHYRYPVSIRFIK